MKSQKQRIPLDRNFANALGKLEYKPALGKNEDVDRNTFVKRYIPYKNQENTTTARKTKQIS